jgi:eukaryotic-like serine/threonine-protein kinase
MTMNLEIGTTIGDYQIIGILGAGGMGKVYKVRNVISDRVEALKVLLPDLATEPDLADRFVREIKVQASLEHPNIASLHTALRVENQLLMLMEFVEGMTLDQKLKAGPLPISEAVEYVAQVLGALGYAHQHGVIHRDIKPANMMLTPAGVIKLMDFGIAKAATDRKLTMTGTTMGSLYYMSPEQIKGATTLDSRSDLYSIGVTLYELVTGKRPFDGDSQFAIMAAHLEKNPIPPITLDPRLPAELNDIILLSVAKDPAARFQSAEAFRNALLNIQGLVGRPAGAVSTAASGATAAPQVAPVLPQEAPPAPATAAKGHRGMWIAAGALCTALLVVGIIQFGPWKKTSAGSAPPPPELPAAAAPAPQVMPPPAAPVVQPETQPAAVVAPVVQTPAAGAGGKTPVQRPAPMRAAPVGRSVTSAPVAAQPQANTSAPPPAASTSPAPSPRPPAPAAPDAAATRAELQQVRESLVMVAARAATARNSLQTLQRSQAASGLNLRADIAEAATLAGTFIEGAQSALNAGDAASARSFTEKAERQVEKVEKFLGR